VTISEAAIVEAAQKAERAALSGQPADAALLIDALNEGHRIFCDLLVSRPGSRAVAKVWNLSADDLRLIVLSRLIAQTLETAANTLAVVDERPLN
jgi:hypothetical protein